MIILDTNQLERAQPPDGPLLAMLRTLARQTRHTLALPEMVLEEHLAHYRRKVEEADRERRAATRALRLLVPYWAVEDRDLDLLTAVHDRAERLKQVFTILRTPDSACRESLMREAHRRPPASVSWDRPGTGARDVAIWLTAVAACEDDEDLQVYFVAEDNGAFGTDTLKRELAVELQDRLAGRADAFRYCAGLDALLAELATKLPDTPELQDITTAEPVRQAVTEAMNEPDVFIQLAGATGLTAIFYTWASQLDGLEKVSVGNVLAYEIGGEVWVCARVTWEVIKKISSMVPIGTAEIERHTAFTFRVNTTLVMQVDSGDSIVAAEVASRSQAFRIRQELVA